MRRVLNAEFVISQRTALDLVVEEPKRRVLGYTDNWSSEMNEEFCFWNFSKWKQVLTEIGFKIYENPNNAAEGSRIYINPWIVEHRHTGHVEIFDLEGQVLPWPPTNMVLVAEKPFH
jgi:hypothetical protein